MQTFSLDNSQWCDPNDGGEECTKAVFPGLVRYKFEPPVTVEGINLGSRASNRKTFA